MVGSDVTDRAELYLGCILEDEEGKLTIKTDRGAILMKTTERITGLRLDNNA